MELALMVFGQVLTLFMSIYTGVIVARYMSFDAAINRARSIIFNLEQTWEYRYMDQRVPDPGSPSGQRSVFMSRVLSSNSVSWLLTEIGLELKEMGHWVAVRELDRIGMEIDALRDDFVEKAQLVPTGSSLEVLENIADWHRRISSLEPSTWQIVMPWHHTRYKHLSCIHVDESTGEWHEVYAKQPKTVFDDPTMKI
jgi:hypothetical protein